MVSPPGSTPMRIDRYELYDVIASGGMATVHLGRLVGPAGFGRTVAIKRLHPHLAKEPEFVAMLNDEARVAGRIGHPNIVPTLDIVTAEGELFLVMEYVPGLTLAALAKLAADDGDRIPLAVACAIMAGVLHGLDAAHEVRDESGRPLDVVHRDVSPQNILVGADGAARLLDFGIAKAVGRLHTTRDGQLKGKVGYMAPEQLGDRAIDRRTDIYAASVVFWETVTGERLFDGADAATIFGKVMQMKVSPPSARARGVPGELDGAILTGLEREPSRRWARARDMAAAVERAAPIARASEVAAWVAGVAERQLAERAELVLAIEKRGAETRRREQSTAKVNDVSTHEAQRTPSAATHAGVTSSTAPIRPRLAPMIAGATVAVAIAVAAILATTRDPAHSAVPLGDGNQRHESLSTASPGAPQPDLPHAGALPNNYATQASAAPIGGITSAPDPKSAPAITGPAALKPPAPARSNAARTPAAKPRSGKNVACDPPFTIDDQGHKHYKPDCL